MTLTRAQRMSFSLGVSTTPSVALPQIAPFDPAEVEESDSDSDSDSDSESAAESLGAEMPPPPHEMATNGAGAV